MCKKSLLRAESSGQEHGHAHPHGHEQDPPHGHEHSHVHTHEHEHSHEHDHPHGQDPCFARKGEGLTLTVRAASGLSGDMLVAGLARMTETDQEQLDLLLLDIRLPALAGGARLEERSVNAVSGWGLGVSLPPESAHRTLKDILGIIEGSSLSAGAKAYAEKAFSLLATAEAGVHGVAPAEVRFHEVGALDSILDICLAAMLFDILSPALFVCSPLPLADGGVHCAHGFLPTPAPAVLALLEGVPVRGFPGIGETVTPTAIALLKAFGAAFGPWPAMRIERRALVYGGKIFPDAPNGALWACGRGE